jgi:TRAP-type C4-dicarboxylate transport system permease large subunit
VTSVSNDELTTHNAREWARFKRARRWLWLFCAIGWPALFFTVALRELLFAAHRIMWSLLTPLCILVTLLVVHGTAFSAVAVFLFHCPVCGRSFRWTLGLGTQCCSEHGRGQ